MCKWEPSNIWGKGRKYISHRIQGDSRFKIAMNDIKSNRIRQSVFSFVKLRKIFWTPCIYHLTILDFSPGETQAIVGRILCQESDFHNCHTYKQTLWDSAVFSVFTIWQLDFPPGGRTRLLLALSCVYLLLQWAAPCERGDTIRLN